MGLGLQILIKRFLSHNDRPAPHQRSQAAIYGALSGIMVGVAGLNLLLLGY